MSNMPWELDLRGARFGHLEVRQRRGLTDRGHREWLCRCDCGTCTTLSEPQLRDGAAHCGCRASAPTPKPRRSKNPVQQLLHSWGAPTLE